MNQSLFDLFRLVVSPKRLFELMQLGIVPLYRINMFRCTDGKTKETPPAPSSVDDVVRLFNEGALRKAYI